MTAAPRHSDHPASTTQPASPARDLAPRPARARRRRRGWLAPLGFGSAALIGAGAYLALADSGLTTWGVPPLAALVEQGLVLAGLGIDQVEISGHRHTSDAAVLDTLDLGNVRTLWLIDTRAVRERIERLPWIATAEINRVYPGRLAIRLTERSAFAVWQRGGAAHLIDRSGRVLAAISPAAPIDLPRVVGEGAAEGVAALHEMIAASALAGRRLAYVERIEERRWRLVLAEGSRIELPAEAPQAALARIGAAGVLGKLLKDGPVALDLRAHDRLTVGKLTGSPATTPTPVAASPAVTQ